MDADNLLAQHRLLRAVIMSDWPTRLDIKVAATIIERYVRKFGNARASLRYIECSTGADRKGVIASTRRLCENGVFNVLREGRGTRPTEYGLNFGFPGSGGADTTTTANSASGGVETTAGGGVETTTSGTSGGAETTESSLTVAGLQDRHTDREIEPAAPSAPPLAGRLAAATAETAGDEPRARFKELWKAYYPGKGRNRKEAEAVYTSLTASAELHAEIVDSAREWYEVWAAQDKPDAPRFTLAKWLERREFECTPPTAYRPKERKAKDRPAANDNRPRGRLSPQLRIIEVEAIGNPFGDFRIRIKLDGPDGVREHVLKAFSRDGMAEDFDVYNKLLQALDESDREDWPGRRVRLEMDDDRIVGIVVEKPGDRVVEIAEAEIVTVDEAKILVARITDADGKPEGRIDFVIESDDEQEQKAGQASLERLRVALDMHNIEEADDLLHRPFILTAKGDFKMVSDEMGQAA